MIDFEHTFADYEITLKRHVLQERCETYRREAYSWWINAETLKQQPIQRSQQKRVEQQIQASLLNAEQNLSMLKLTEEMLEELEPSEDQSLDALELTLANMTDVIRLKDLEPSVNGMEE